MCYLRVKKIDDSNILRGYTGDLYAVECTENNGKSWRALSTHLSFEGAERKMHSHVAQHPECALWEKIIDRSTGIELAPGKPAACQGNPTCCDECDYLMTCFPGPDWERHLQDIQDGNVELQEHQLIGE